MDVSYIAKRITELRLARNISEYQMSLELGQSKSTVYKGLHRVTV